MRTTGTHFSYYFVCQRKLWLFAHGIQMEHTSDLVYEGKLIHETSYPQRAERYQEIEIGGIKIDYFDAKNKVIHEVKKSDKLVEAHEWQVKYYMYVLRLHGVECMKTILEYPALRKTSEVYLSKVDEQNIDEILIEINYITESDVCPPKIKIGSCRKCSYYDFCWSGEE